ncbi:MAG TPA: TonB-dependent receptor [Thermoanaerobaculia bacterium]|jgi:iron complex outermembrane receptor protein|nr:TonB-dependent receptor [Thermoanaerobaculia bacterium]
MKPRRSSIARRLRDCLVTAVLCWPAPAAALADQPPEGSGTGTAVDLTELSLEELMDVEVVSVSKRSERISAAAAAVYVITQEDLRRSGATSIAEALRMVPGLEVARIDANTWAVSARGFNGRFANKLLVLIDGRSVYTPLFSGVFWDVQDTLLEDVDRIEVIRGPGATLWGANAVNGVINILTKSARETLGSLVTAGGGTEERWFLGARYGGSLGENGAWRAYVKGFDRDAGADPAGGEGVDGWSVKRGGFRVDRKLGDAAEWTLQGDLYDGEVGERLTLAPSLTALVPVVQDTETAISGGNLLGRWQRTLSAASELTVQLYYDRTDRDYRFLDESRDTFDLELQHDVSPAPRHRVVWGLGYRRTADDLRDSDLLAFQPDRRTDDLASAFLQDEINLRADRLWLTVGSKLEHNDYSGFEVQPNARLLWTPGEHRTLWAAVSRAVRTPSRAEHDLQLSAPAFPAGALFPGSPPAIVATLGDRSFDSEELLAYELGYRAGVAPGLFVDLAAFYNDYDRLRTVRAEPPFLQLSPPPPHLVIPSFASNDMEGETYGAELAADWRPAGSWRLSAAYTWLEMRLRNRFDPADVTVAATEGQSPQQQLFLRSAMDLPGHFELDLAARYVDSLATGPVSGYTSADLRLGWKPRAGLELSLVGQNLLDAEHLEFAPEIIPTHPTAVERAVYGKVTWRF